MVWHPNAGRLSWVSTGQGRAPRSPKPGFPRWFLPVTENGSTIEHRSKAWPFILVWRLGLVHAAYQSPRQDAFGCAIGEQPGIRGDLAAVEFELQATVEIDPQMRLSGFTRRVTWGWPVVMMVLH